MLDLPDSTITQYLSDPQMWKGAICTALGTIAHFVNRVASTDPAEENRAEFAKTYWTANKRASVLSIVGAIVGFMYLYEQDTTSILAYVGMGYVSDSVFNRAAKVADALMSPGIAVRHARAGYEDRRKYDKARIQHELKEKYGKGEHFEYAENEGEDSEFDTGGGGGFDSGDFDSEDRGRGYGRRYGHADRSEDDDTPPEDDRPQRVEKPKLDPPTDDDVKRG